MSHIGTTTCPDCGRVTVFENYYWVCYHCDWWSYKRAHKKAHRSLEQSIYRNLWHCVRRAKAYPVDRQGIAQYMLMIKANKPVIYRNFIRELRSR